MNRRLVLFFCLLLPSLENYSFFGPLIKLSFNAKTYYITVKEDYYTYWDLKWQIAELLDLPCDKIETIDLSTRIYLNLESPFEVKNLNYEKPLNLLITKSSTLNNNID